MGIARRTDWEREELPAKRTTVALDRTFSGAEMTRIRRGLVPAVMEDKWFIYWEGNHLHFHRSWTGFCLYVVRFEPDGEGGRMTEAAVNRDPEQYTETRDARDAELIPYLVDVLLLRRPAVFPDEGLSNEMRAMQMWSFVGRVAPGRVSGGE